MNRNLIYLICLLPVSMTAIAEELVLPEPSEETSECLICHEMATPGIVMDWRQSRHAATIPAEALEKDALQRRISAESLPEALSGSSVGCFECHGLNTENHADSFEHFGYQINIVVSPADCATCHPVEQEQYAGSKKAHAVANLRDNPVYHSLETAVIGAKQIQDGKLVSLPPTANTQGEVCYACHGTVVEVKGLKTVETDFGDMEVPDLTNWPNAGVGRINPDGSRGSCTACHPRHSFSISIARKPYTCAQCHVEPDVPAWDVWKESKHGNIVLSDAHEYDWKAVPWKAGSDFRAPSCSVCHNALITDPMGDQVIAERTHDFGSRLWVRLFGLPTSHPQPVHGDTTTIRNADGQPLPVTLGGTPASDGLISRETMLERESAMKTVCRSCHSTDWVNGHFMQMDEHIGEIDQMVIQTTALLQEAWQMGLADPENLFDEPLEHLWVNQWLINANAARYASAMNGQDYAAFKYGWWGMSQTMAEMHKAIKEQKSE